MFSGCYYEPIAPGQGLDVYIKDDQRLIAYWYTFDSNGDRRFFWVHGVEGNKMTLYTTEGGTFDNPMRCNVLRAGTAWFEGSVFLYDSKQHGRNAVELSTIATSTDPRSGAYYQPNKSGSGLSIQYFDSGKVSAYWFTYCDGQQRWYTCQGEADNLKMYEWLGGDFRYPGGELIEVGQASLDGRIFTYDLDAVRVKAQGELQLTRLF